jgi:hypothetical protein
MTDIIDCIIKKAIQMIIVIQEGSHKRKGLIIHMRACGGKCLQRTNQVEDQEKQESWSWLCKEL